jgi:hypothetical protein
MDLRDSRQYCRIWLELKNAHAGNAEVQARLYATYRREYENFTHIPGESIDALFQRFTVVVNNIKANVDVLPYDDHDRAVKLLHTLDRTVWDGKVEAIFESENYTTLMVNELFSQLKSAKVDRGLTTRPESLTDSHSLTLVGGKTAKSNANASSRMYSLSSLMTLLDEEFDALGEDELVLLTRRFESIHENRVNSRRNSRTCFKCGKTRHFFAECPMVNNHDKHKSKDKGRRSKKKEHEHGRKTRSRENIKRSSDIDSGSEDVSSSSSEQEEEDSKKKKKKKMMMKKMKKEEGEKGEEGEKKKKKNFVKYLKGLCCTTSKTLRCYNKKDGLCGMAHSSGSKRS